jgi:DNA-binding HxlR family transcriptional regulator
MIVNGPGSEQIESCVVRNVLSRFSDRWSVLVLCQLEHGTLRFSAIKALIGDISQRMLARALRRLEQDGLIERRVHATVPPSVEYSLTSLGRSLLGPLHSMIHWAELNEHRVHAARASYVPPRRYPPAADF